MTPVIVYDTGHSTSARICEAFAAGCNAEVRLTGSALVPGEIAFLYGALRGNAKLFRQLQDAKQDFLFCDNGYMGRGHFDGYYRITRNAWCHDGHGQPDYARLERLGVQINPWRTSSGYILVCPPIQEFCKAWRFQGASWHLEVTTVIRQVTKRKVVWRFKPGEPRAPDGQPSLAEHLDGAWAVVAHDSNVALEAVIAGVPAFVTGPSPARPLARTDVSKIEIPYYPKNRREVLAVLAANQWTLDEMRDGVAARALGVAR